MAEGESQSIRSIRAALAAGEITPSSLAEKALARSNRNASSNTYIWQNPAWTRAEAEAAERMPRRSGGIFDDGRDALWGIPVSVKDYFDITGVTTTCGARFLELLHSEAIEDSWIVRQLRSRGAVITGKTHLHPLAYGITGENEDYGDCVQPWDLTALTGGSSSGAAASIQEGSAALAIGTDTGGSIRVPAALCGLAGYRASLGFGRWDGGYHLAQSFDTIGCLFRDLEDAPLLIDLFASDALGEPDLAKHPDPGDPIGFSQVAVVENAFLNDCDPQIISSFHNCIGELRSLGIEAVTIPASWWAEAYDIFAPIQAYEAAHIHSGHFHRIEPAIRARLEWGASIPATEIVRLRERHADFRSRMDNLFTTYGLVLLPAAPVRRLNAGADHTATRHQLLRYTTPFSLAGVPVVTLPCAAGGMQLAGARGKDARLLHLAARMGFYRRMGGSSSRT